MTMRNFGKTLLVASALCILAAIWLPGAWWQWLCTGLLVGFAGAAILGQHQEDE